MTADEMQTAERRYRARIEAILHPDEQAIYNRYEQRIVASLTQDGSAPVAISPSEQAILDHIATDTEAAALYKQVLALLRIEHLPQ